MGCIDINSPDWAIDAAISKAFRSGRVDIYAPTKRRADQQLRTALHEIWGMRALPKGLGERVDRRVTKIALKIRNRMNLDAEFEAIMRNYDLRVREWDKVHNIRRCIMHAAERAGLLYAEVSADLEADMANDWTWARTVLFERIAVVENRLVLRAQCVLLADVVRLYEVDVLTKSGEVLSGYVVRAGYEWKALHDDIKIAEAAWRSTCFEHGIRFRSQTKALKPKRAKEKK